MRLYFKYFIPWLKELKRLHANRKATAELAALSRLVFSYPTLKQHIEAEEFRLKLTAIAKQRLRRQHIYNSQHPFETNH